VEKRGTKRQIAGPNVEARLGRIPKGRDRAEVIEKARIRTREKRQLQAQRSQRLPGWL